MAKRYYNLEKETRAFLKRMEETRGVLPDGSGIQRVNDYIVKRKGLDLFLGSSDRSCLDVLGIPAPFGQYVQVSSNSSLLVTPSWEMIIWIFPRILSGVRVHIGKALNSQSLVDYFLMQINANVALNSANAGTTYIATGNKALTLNTWQFFNFGRDSTTSNLFLSKNLDTPTTVQQTVQTSSSAPFTIGNWGDTGQSRPSDAVYDGSGRWNRTLTADERSFLYNSGRGVSYFEILAYRLDILNGCISYWQLSESSGIRYDWHGSNHLLPINNPLKSTNGIITKLF